MPVRQELPESFGRYRILRKLGEGGMGAVYLAEDTRLGRRVALKVPHFTADDGPAVVERFYREARVAAGIDHPNLCPVHDVDEHGGVHYLTMPFIEGTTLSRRLAWEGAWPSGRAARLAATVARAVDALHARGIIHRDLKPHNIMVRPDGEPVVMDFGLARSLAASRRLTEKGQVLGTPSYMSPEQVRGQKELGPATDVYSLGVIFYQLLTGRVPFEGDVMAVFAQILHADPEPPSRLRPGLDARVEAICLRALAKRPEDRFPGMAAFAAALEEYARQSGLGTAGPGATTPEAPPQPADVPPVPPTLPGEHGPRLPNEIVNAVGMRLVLVPAGTFLMGSPESEEGREEDEGPRHEVEITRPIYLGACPVTQEEYHRVTGTTPSWFAAAGGGRDKVTGVDTRRFPVENVTWDDAVEFCLRLSELADEKKAGRRYRLPTEAEWEYACRGGANPPTPFSFGPSLSSTQANFDGNQPYGGAVKSPYLQRPTPVAFYRPNGWGLFDMHGNVWEWCADGYGADYYRRAPRRDPLGPHHQALRVLRGGSWGDGGRDCRSAFRNRYANGDRGGNVGFRVVCFVPRLA